MAAQIDPDEFNSSQTGKRTPTATGERRAETFLA